MRTVKVYPESWPLHSAFIIARGARHEAGVVVVELEENGTKGIGECTPYARYGETEASVLAQIALLLPEIEQGLTRHALQQRLPAGAARNAIDSALWDLQVHSGSQNLWQLTGTTAPVQIETAQTVCVDVPEMMASSALALWENGAKLIKIKLDDHMIAERLVAIRSAVPQAMLIVDANESWHSEGLAARCQLLADLNISMLEQPLPAADDVALENFVHPLPICADESCHSVDSLAALRGRYEMVNIKLDKTGGLTAALELARCAQDQGFAIMLGCMLCTSRAIRAALPLVPKARFVDLDGPTWLAIDAEPALAFDCGRILLSPSSLPAESLHHHVRTAPGD
ncbi:L-Ala-D/L-Glu epimerase [Erwinia amylovora]|uniref:Dipeptide epimerase n=1 Tax=Erwinia amylovora ATCC BAA-2158 TaxID=889211 RepID=E5B5I8_ERWAM|nr:L-Ala-D/L-Glu epimerase [Erwinia amylovora]CBX80741.1 putative muconate cycloisomerase I [Erwinia amylovora ATCC BAA-2158]UDJ88391.1 L-Ala-D/L-Glu epimerase [Erwinia amylovora]UDJ99850.1 L-Ala-D/L-Glu epimerase [Erwinia amylovora]UDK88094.1 L-Ala-D/L-Glu epimerase [Erwinia amylovora]UDK91488.1 L-Ala-D/L-Glu epimerase [Erwinia amylovora]